MLYMVTFTINIPPMLAYIPAPWILWVLLYQLSWNFEFDASSGHVA